MAAPITNIQRYEPTEAEIKQQKIEELTKLLSNNEEAINHIFEIIGELNDMGVLEAATTMLQAKEQITKIALQQVSKDPVTNLMNTITGATGALMKADSEKTTKLVNSAVAGIDEGTKFLETDKKITVMNLLKTLNDPDINRSIGFTLAFLKGMGKELNKK
ncbi:MULTISPECIES: DUF1641 domain-containing protein [Bacillus]|uniref:DUF1641 domain-containing protein n=1 Tax=Bacillus TaxID=1386 RepID=UPI00031059BB|nr:MULTISPECIES: DUF1641 domain-containing protein [Bacillus]